MKCALIGERLGHSYSKLIHEAFGAYDYDLVSMPLEKVADFVKNNEYGGLNVTIPYKKTVIPCCDYISPQAQKIGSVNTIVYKDNRLEGHNTDYFGFSLMAKRAGISFAGKKVVILGTGGTSLTAQAVTADEGASEIVVVSRTGKVNYSDLSSVCDFDIVINTTPVGMYPKNGEQPIKLDMFQNCSGVIDVIYNPLRTELILDAMQRNIPCTGGLYMLVAQAAMAYELFTGKALEAGMIDKVFSELEASVENIVLIGMPGSGKSSVGREVANRLKRVFVDCDNEIEKNENMTIPEIFAAKGEAYFREAEKKVMRDFGKEKSLVIATGGGAVLFDENYHSLKQNGRIYLIDRPTDMLATKGRPLSKDRTTVEKLYKTRKPLYDSWCDERVENTASIGAAVKKIIK